MQPQGEGALEWTQWQGLLAPTGEAATPSKGGGGEGGVSKPSTPSGCSHSLLAPF